MRDFLDAQFALSHNGSLIYVAGSGVPEATLVWVDRQGETQPVTDARRAFYLPRISPDGQRIAVGIYREANYDIWVYDIARGTMTRLTTAPSDEEAAVWAPDGKRVAFTSNRDGPINLYWKAADGSGLAERLYESKDEPWPFSWSPDSRVLAFMRWRTPPRNYDIWMLPMEGEGGPEPFLATPFNECQAAFSPDGQWIAYVSDEVGRPEVYVRAYPGPGGKWPISTEGGIEPVWGPNAGELFYRSLHGKMMAVPVRLEPEFNAEKPKILFEDRFETVQSYVRNYDVSPDGKRFVMIQREHQSPPTEIVVVLNWFEELKRLVPKED